jgi:hypothetical protein
VFGATLDYQYTWLAIVMIVSILAFILPARDSLANA